MATSRDGDELSANMIRRAFRRASDEAYSAVAHPIEGTILTVARAAAEAAEATPGDDLVEVIEAAVAGARAALEQTPDMLPVLRDAGVVEFSPHEGARPHEVATAQGMVAGACGRAERALRSPFS